MLRKCFVPNEKVSVLCGAWVAVDAHGQATDQSMRHTEFLEPPRCFERVKQHLGRDRICKRLESTGHSHAPVSATVPSS